MPRGALNEPLDALLLSSLEDEFCDLPSEQVAAALRQANGDLTVARHLCIFLCGGAEQQQQQQAAGEQHRPWWPQWPGPPPPPRGSSSSSSSSSTSDRRSASAAPLQRPLLVPHQLSPSASGSMQPAAAARSGQPSSAGRQSPATAVLRRLVGASSSAGGGSARGTSTDGSAGAARPPPGLLARPAKSSATTGGAAPSPLRQRSGNSSSSSSSSKEPLHPHYAAVFLTDRSRQALLQHVPPLHEATSADHMTMAYKPAPEMCLRLPLGREAQLLLVGAAADYRAQAVAVQHPSWVPFLSESTPHITISVGADVPAREAGDLTAAALESPGSLAPVARLKLLQGVVGVQLSDGRRVFSAEELQQALAEAAATEQAGAAPAPTRILQRGAAPPAPAPAPQPPAAVAAPVQQLAPAPPPVSSSKAAPWDLDALLDQLHLAEPAPVALPPPRAAAPGSHGAGAAAPGPVATQQPAAGDQPRRGLLKLPAAVANEMAAPRRSGSPAGHAVGRKPAVLQARRPQQQQQRQQRQPWDYGGEWVEPAAPDLPGPGGKSVAEEAAEAAAAGEPLDMVSSLAAYLQPTERAAGSAQQAQQAQQAQRQQRRDPSEPPLPSPKMLAGAGSSTGSGGGGAPAASGYDTSGSSSEDASSGAAAAAAAGPVDPESKAMLLLQYPSLHELVVETALRMHGGALEESARFLAVLESQQGMVQAAGAAAVPAPQHATLGSFLAGVLPEAAAPAYDARVAASSSAGSFADELGSGDGYLPAAGVRGGGRGSGGVTAGWAVQPGGGRGRGGRGARRASGTAGDDPLSVTERQAMNTHLQAKRVYTQAAEEAFARGQVALGKELAATARGHADAASHARRRANVSAFRSTNAAVRNSFTLDLHGQHVDEALASLERYLVTLGGLGHPGGVLLQVITGQGRHSVGNQPRVLPAVVRYLSDAGYSFDAQEGNAGIINVSIGGLA